MKPDLFGDVREASCRVNASRNDRTSMTGAKRAAALAALCAVCAGHAAAAEQHPPDRVRRVHGGFGGGTYLGLTGPASGLTGFAELYPAGRFGRYGLRVEGRSVKQSHDGQATAGVVYEVAASRPRLQLALYADAGVSWEGAVRPVVGGGVETHLWVYGPVALVTTAGLGLRVDGTDSVLSVTGSLQLHLAW